MKDWTSAANSGQSLRSRIFCYDLDTICKLLENEFELSNKNAPDYATRKKQFLELLPEVKEKYMSKITSGYFSQIVLLISLGKSLPIPLV